MANMENVENVYKRPFSKDYPVVCTDESPKQLIKNTRLPIKMVKAKYYFDVLGKNFSLGKNGL